MVQIRPATPADVDAMGEVHVRAWQRAYRGHMPDAYLDGLHPQERARLWLRVLERAPANTLLVAEGEGILGFVNAGPAGGAGEAAVEGEVFSLNVDPDHWGSGAGRALLAEAERRLAAGYPEAILWVHPDNARARRFYEREGWRDDGEERIQEVLGVTVPEVRYRRDLRGAGRDG